jgi:hypothetical protein
MMLDGNTAQDFQAVGMPVAVIAEEVTTRG